MFFEIIVALQKFIIPVIVIGIIFVLFLVFCWLYVKPAKKIAKHLSRVIDGIKEIENVSSPIHLSHLKELFNSNETLNHLWAEYEESLHKQYNVVDGEQEIFAIRATIPAEVYFTTEVLVDTPLKTEFFKHLPGILTGIGIIGTFIGLIAALLSFDTSTPDKISASLTALMHGVLEAFVASAVAITMAMVVTIIEKTILTQRYKAVEELVQCIDGLYQAGAGEEYLASLVKSSEESATQSRQLTDTFTNDLKILLTNLTERQITAGKENNAFLAKRISETISEGLQAPLNQLSELVQVASGRQGDAVNTLLQDTLAHFTAKIDETFGNQFTNLSNMMGESVIAINDMKSGFRQLIDEMGSTGKNATESMQGQLQEMMADAEKRQQEMNRKTSEFLEQMHLYMQKSHADNEAQYQQRDQAIQQQTSELMSTVGTEVNNMTEQTAEVVAAMKENIDKLTEVSLGTVEKMNSGAETMHRAAMEFSGAGEKVSRVFDQGNDLFSKLSESGLMLSTASSALKETVASYNSTRNSLTEMINSLGSLFDEANDKATISRAIVDDLNRVADKFKTAQQETEEYLSQITTVLETGFNDFSEAVAGSMDRSKGLFDVALSESVGKVSNQLEAICDALEEIPSKLAA